ncbi:MAG: hypothetical protein IPI81_07655 [Flavobacteriales bacterium]|nr:hypothetical protein [Flavobacteriales bacterium]
MRSPRCNSNRWYVDLRQPKRDLRAAGNGSFSWTGPNFTSKDQNPTVGVAGTYLLTVTGANGCSRWMKRRSIPMMVNPVQCDRRYDHLRQPERHAWGSGNGSFSWTGPNYFTSNDQNPTVSVAGTYPHRHRCEWLHVDGSSGGRYRSC